MAVNSADFYQVLWQLSRAISTEASPCEAAGHCLRILIPCIGAQCGSVLLYSSSDGKLHTIASAGPMANKLQDIVVATDEGIEGGVYTSGQPRIVADLAADPDLAGRYSLGAVYRIKTLLCVPLFGKDKAIGCLELINKESQKPFDENDCELTLSYASFMGYGMSDTDFKAARPVRDKVVLSLSGVSKRAAGKDSSSLLSDLGFDLHEKELLNLRGLSHRQQSALISILSAAAPADSGSITLDGAALPASGAQGLELRRKQVGIVSPQFGLLPHLTVEKNVALAASLCQDPLPVAQVLSICGINFGDQYPRSLSDVQRLQVLFARAIVKNPRFLLACWPDDATGKALLYLTHQFMKRSTAGVVIMGSDPALELAADRILTLSQGALASIALGGAEKDDNA